MALQNLQVSKVLLRAYYMGKISCSEVYKICGAADYARAEKALSDAGYVYLIGADEWHTMSQGPIG